MCTYRDCRCPGQRIALASITHNSCPVSAVWAVAGDSVEHAATTDARPATVDGLRWLLDRAPDANLVVVSPQLRRGWAAGTVSCRVPVAQLLAAGATLTNASCDADRELLTRAHRLACAHAAHQLNLWAEGLISQGSTVVFCDGSKHGDQAAWAWSRSDGATASGRLGEHVTSNAAELVAVVEAVEAAPTDVPVVVCSDLETAPALLASAEHPSLAKRYATACATRAVTLCWVPAHVGVAGNEHADKLARLARTS